MLYLYEVKARGCAIHVIAKFINQYSLPESAPTSICEPLKPFYAMMAFKTVHTTTEIDAQQTLDVGSREKRRELFLEITCSL